MGNEVYGARGYGELGLEELALPAQPRVVEDLLILPVRSGIYVLGGEPPQHLSGQTAAWLFESLVPLLDGTRNLHDLLDACEGLHEDMLRDMLTFLLMHGLIEQEEGDAAPDSVAEDAPLAVFFSRYLRLTGRHARRAGPIANLRQAHVRLVALSPELDWAVEHMADGLRENGVGSVRAQSPEDWQGADLGIALLDIRSYPAHHARLERAGVPVMPIDPLAGVLAPLYSPRVTACGHCVMLQIGESLPAPRTPTAACSSLFTRAMLHRAILRCLAGLTGVFGTEQVIGAEIWDADARRVRRIDSVLSLPNCPSCGGRVEPRDLAMPSGHRESIAALFHRGTALKPWDLNKPAMMQAHFKPENLALARPDPVPTGNVRSSAAVPTRLADAPELFGNVSGRLDARTLGTLLRYSAGFDVISANGVPQIRRVTASGGNLGLAPLWVEVADVEGLVPGWSAYDASTHRLIPRTAMLRVAQAWTCAAPLSGPIGAWLVIGNDVGKGYQKYAGRGYLYSLLDAGLMLGRIIEVCTALGLDALATWEFDDGLLLEGFGFDPARWDIAALVAIWGRGK